MSFSYSFLVTGFSWLTSLICRIDDSQVTRIPDHGPFILVANHVNSLEVPIFYTRLQPRPLAGLALAGRWNNPGYRWLLNTANAHPLRRGEADVAGLKKGLELLKAGNMLGIAPEGTRSRHGRMQEGKPGVVLLALHSGAPILPLAHYGSEHYKTNLRRLRRSDFNILVGRPFRLDAGGVRVSQQVRRQMVDEIMYQVAALLPPAYRGHYADLDSATDEYIAYLD
jgi:1-acyl-sn-glycerol-3-phosphate acyltransferase